MHGATLARMDTDINQAKRRNAERAAALRLQAAHASTLPHDPTLTPDAIALRAAQRTPLELMLDVINDEDIDLRTRLDAAKAAASYMHRQQATTQRVETDASAEEERLFKVLCRMTEAQRETLLAIQRAKHVAGSRDEPSSQHEPVSGSNDEPANPTA